MNPLNSITYRINGAAVKLLNIENKTEGHLDILTQANIKFHLKFSRVNKNLDISSFVENNTIPDDVKPRIFITSQGNHDLKENQFWLTLDELYKQQQFVVNLVNRTHHWCIAGLKKSITNDYSDQSKGFACIHGSGRGNNIQTDEDSDLIHPDFMLGHRLAMCFNAIWTEPLIEIEFMPVGKNKG